MLLQVAIALTLIGAPPAPPKPTHAPVKKAPAPAPPKPAPKPPPGLTPEALAAALTAINSATITMQTPPQPVDPKFEKYADSLPASTAQFNPTALQNAASAS